MRGFIVYASHTAPENETFIQLFGRLENSQTFAALMPFEPYFFISERDVKKAKPLLGKYKTEKTSLTDFEGRKVLKISSRSQTDLNKLIPALHKKNINTYEADIKPHQRFFMDRDIYSTISIEGEYTSEEKVDRFYQNPEVSPIHFEEHTPKLKILSIDIESDKKFNNLFCVGLHSHNYKKSFIISDKKIKDAVSCKTEPELLLKLKEEIIKFDPDIITGWHVIDFDLMYLKEKFAENKIQFDIGRTNQNASIKIQSDFFRSSTADIPGRQVLDGLNLIRDPFIKEAPMIKHADFETFTLEDVSQELLGEGKTIKGKSRHKEIEQLYHKDQKKLVEYNLQDARLAYEIITKTRIIELAIERATLTGMPLNKITASIAAFDSLYIRAARKKGLVSPTTQYESKTERIKGGYVMQSVPGIYHNLLVFDFKSLYPSVIKTFNIDPSSQVKKPLKKSSLIESPNKAYFKNTDGILPEIIEKLHKAREKAKHEKRELASYAIKIIMNSFWGVLASQNCRYFNLDMGNAITSFSRWAIQTTAKEIEKLGHKVIYMDTDSCFVDANLPREHSLKLGNEIEQRINNFFKLYVSKNYKRTSYLELEFEKLYLAFMMPPIRHSDIGSKKRYAGLLEKNGKEKIEVVGLEAIRGDWTEAAQEFQMQLLEKIFHRQEFAKFIKDYVGKIKEGKLDNKLVYRKSLRKPVESYVKTTPPHVKAARQLPKLESNIIQYYITTSGPEPIQKLKHKIDYKHYIDKQIKPIANTLLFFFDKNFDEIIQASKQMKLF